MYLPLLLLLTLPLTAVLSWVLNIYTDGMVKSLLGSDGIRWSVSNLISNLYYAPIAGVLVFLVCTSVLFESGLMGTLLTVIHERKWKKSTLSLKQRRALMFTLGLFELIIVLFIILLFFPGSILFTAFGSFESSALDRGWTGIVAFILIVLGNVFGYASGKLVTKSDFMLAHTSFISKCAGYFVTLFLSAEVIAVIKYTGLLGDGASIVLSWILYYVPLFFYFTSSILSSRTYQMKPFIFL